MCHHVEDNDHLWVCSAQTEGRRIILTTMIDTVIASGTPQEIIDVIHYGLSSLFNLQQDRLGDHHIDPVDPVILKDWRASEEQGNLGWDDFVRGRHSHLWADAYETDLERKPKQKVRYTKKGLPRQHI